MVRGANLQGAGLSYTFHTLPYILNCRTRTVLHARMAQVPSREAFFEPLSIWTRVSVSDYS